MMSLFNSTATAQNAEPLAHDAPVAAPRAAAAERPVISLDDAGEPESYRGDISLALAEHARWLESRGHEGVRAELTGCSLHNLDLHGADLRLAFLRKADLSGADLSMADLRGACLIQADLRKANLLGARLHGAALQGAVLDGALRLLPEQVAGANLSGTTLPAKLDELLAEKLKSAQALCHRVRQILAAMLLACLGGGLLVAGISDVQLVMNFSLVPLPLLDGVLPADAFLLLAPPLLFSLFIAFHLQLTRLWGRMAELPAVFPDGRPLDQKAEWLLNALVRSQFQWAGDLRLPPSLLEVAVLTMPAYWIVPGVVLLAWGRYLTRLDLQGAIYLAGVVVAAVVVATFLPRRVALRADETSPAASPPERAGLPSRLAGKACGVAVLGVALCLLSFGTVHGVPHNAPNEGTGHWATRLLWMAGYDPFARFPEAQVSAAPQGWSGSDADLHLVRGPRLDGIVLRHAVAPGVFLVNARLGEADLRQADLTEADLRGADLHKTNLRATRMDRARLGGANLQGASLPGATLVGAGIRAADLSYALLAEARLDRAVLKESNIFSANLRGASLFAASLDGADLRDSNLEGANLNQASLRGAYLWSARLSGARLREAQLQNAILIEADLRRAVLRGAVFHGAVLRGAQLDGADLEAADLRGAVGLTAAQLCAAPSWRKAQLDDDLTQQLAATCPP